MKASPFDHQNYEKINNEPRYTANIFQNLLRVRDNTDIGPLRLANSETQNKQFEGLCRQIAQGEIATSEILLTTGVGLPKGSDMPVRLLALLLPWPLHSSQFQK